MSAPAKHTPGPWLQRLHCSEDGAVVIYRADCGMIGEAYAYPRITPEQAAANAALIAAAPDLLASLRELIALADVTPQAAFERAIISRAKVTIAKAEGRQ